MFFSNCDGVVLPSLGDKVKDKEQICPRCECKYENRNTTIIKVIKLYLLIMRHVRQIKNETKLLTVHLLFFADCSNNSHLGDIAVSYLYAFPHMFGPTVEQAYPQNCKRRWIPRA